VLNPKANSKMVCGLIEPEAWSLPSPRKHGPVSESPRAFQDEQPLLCQPQPETEEVLRQDRFSSPKRNFRSSKGRQWQREMFALRAELEATREMITCRFGGERTDFASLQNKISSLSNDSVSHVAATMVFPKGRATWSPSLQKSASLGETRMPCQGPWKEKKTSPRVERMQEPRSGSTSTPPKRRSPSPSTSLLSGNGLPQPHASLYTASSYQFCGVCGMWYDGTLGLQHSCQKDLLDPLSESMEYCQYFDVEQQIKERIQAMQKIDAKDFESQRTGEKEPPEKASDYTRPRGAELRETDNEIDALAAELNDLNIRLVDAIAFST